MLPRAVSFSGGGHLLVYHLGVILRLRAAGLGNADAIRCYAGSSGGAIAACAAACISDIERFATEFALKGESHKGLEAMLPAADTEIAHLTADGRVGISVTRCLTGENVLVREFRSKDALLRAVHASCLIPRSFHPLEFFSLTQTQPNLSRSRFQDNEGVALAGLDGAYVDGGLSCNIPEVPAHRTLRVSVLASPKESLLIANNHSSRIRLPGWIYMSGLRVLLSASNLRAGLAAIAGAPGALRHYYERGQRDCDSFLADKDEWTQPVSRCGSGS